VVERGDRGQPAVPAAGRVERRGPDRVGRNGVGREQAQPRLAVLRADRRLRPARQIARVWEFARVTVFARLDVRSRSGVRAVSGVRSRPSSRQFFTFAMTLSANAFSAPILSASGWVSGSLVYGHRKPARICDVGYDDFVADPVGTVESVRGYFGLALSGAAADAMRAVQAGGASGGAAGSAGRAAVPAHRYAVGDFGLTGEQVDERFGGYLRSVHSTSRMA